MNYAEIILSAPWLGNADDWYEAMAILLAERAPA